MEQGNYGENFDRGYEEQARPRQQVIVIGEPVPDKRTTKNLAICSLVLGILAIVFSFLPYIGIILALIALPQGIVSLVQKRPGKGLAIAGIITGIFGILLSKADSIGSVPATMSLLCIWCMYTFRSSLLKRINKGCVAICPATKSRVLLVAATRLARI